CRPTAERSLGECRARPMWFCSPSTGAPRTRTKLPATAIWPGGRPSAGRPRAVWDHLRVRAALRDRYGGPEVVQVREVEKPVPGKGEVLVRVRGASGNRADLDWRKR